MSLRTELGEGPLLASFVGIGHPAIAEIMAWRGFGILVVDGEHSSLGPSRIEELIRVAESAGARALVRVPAIGPAIAHALDAGADGIIVPRVGSAPQAREAVAAARYPPVGARGAGIGRASRYGQELAGLLKRANDEVLLVVQVETREGLRAVGEIAAVDGVDVLFVGPGDLSVSLGCEIGSARHSEAIGRIIDAGNAAGKAVGIFCLNAEEIGPWLDLGVRLFILSGDLGIFGRACAESAAAATAVLETYSARRNE
jgi:2-keto-3-deoxy-L-rhamnonate aldolase RhmA